MKKIMTMLACCCAMFAAVFAGDEEVTVKVSRAGQNNSALRKECKIEGQKLAVKKYLAKNNSGLPEKIVNDAMASYVKFVDDIEENDAVYEDGELTIEYTATIKQAELAQWVKAEGGDNNAAPDGSSLEIFVMEETPDAGQMQLGDEMGNFFFKRYNMFQRRIRDALVKKVNEFGFSVILLEDNESYEEMKKSDPVLVGVSYDVNPDTRGFKATPNFLRTVQENNPDAIALYYRIDALAFDPDTREIRVTLALNFKDLAGNKTVSIGTKDFGYKTRQTKQDMIMADFGTTTETAMKALLNAEGMGEKMTQMVRGMRNAAQKPKGPMKLVLNCSKVDKKIKIKFRVAIKKALIEKGITDQKHLKIVKDSLSCTVTKKDIGDLDELWVAVSEIITEAGVEDIDDNAAKKNGDTLTVTPGK